MNRDGRGAEDDASDILAGAGFGASMETSMAPRDVSIFSARWRGVYTSGEAKRAGASGYDATPEA